MSYELADINSALKTILEGVSGIGKVHNRNRHTTNPDIFKLLFRDDSREVINGWYFTRSDIEIELSVSAIVRVVHGMRLVGYYSFHDDPRGVGPNTEEIFQTIVTGVVTALSNNFAYTNAWHRMDGPDAMQVPVIGETSHGGVLCHTAEVTVRLEVRA